MNKHSFFEQLKHMKEEKTKTGAHSSKKRDHKNSWL